MIYNLKLVFVFAVAFSLASITGPISSDFHLPTVSLSNAILATNQPWVPAGPASNLETTPIFVDETSELSNLQCGMPPGSCSSIDFTDAPLQPNLIPPLTGTNQFLVTPQIKEHGWYELEFDLSNNFWGCNFNFGNSTCGINIRQGISHLIDKTVFTVNDQAVLGTAVPIDNPVPLDNGGLLTPNTCGWDILYPQTGASCIVGSTDPSSAQFTGGTAYHFAAAPATGANGLGPGAQPNPSMDFCAAAGHMISAGLATGVVSPPTGGFPTTSPSSWGLTGANCVLTGVSSSVATHLINIFIRNDSPKRFDIGRLVAGQICLLFTGSVNTSSCGSVMTTTFGAIQQFQGISTCTLSICQNWWIYTGLFLDIYPFDSSLYGIFNSAFVSGFPAIQPPNGPCSSSAVGTYSASNYMYLCDPAYDNLSSQMEFAACLSAAGDPVVGQIMPTFANCPGTIQLSALTAGYKTEDRFGSHAFTIPLFNTLDQFAYLNNGWQRPINSGNGLPNYFTWLDAWNSNRDTIRQGFSQTTRSINPYIATTTHDFYILGNIMDSLGNVNPYANSQLLDWMTVSQRLACGTTLDCVSRLTYLPPPGTTATFRYTLRNDLFFHDGHRVTSFDIAFTYLSLKATGAFQSTGAAPVIAVTVLSPTQFDFNLAGLGPHTLLSLDSLTVMSAAYWSTNGSAAWNSAVDICASSGSNCFPAQYSLGVTLPTGIPGAVCNSGFSCGFAASNLDVNSAQITPTYNALAAGTLIGSGPWMCVSSTGVRGARCDTNGGATINPAVGDSYTLTRFGTGHAPGTSLMDSYFRSTGAVALWFWSGDNGDFTRDFLNLGVISKCVGAPIGTLGCTQWQQGIGGDVNGNPTIVQPIPQVSIVARFAGIDFVSIASSPTGSNPTAPWTQAAIPMIAVGSAPSFDGYPAPVFYEGTQTLNPASIAGCSTAPSAGYPTAGYDC